MNESKLHERAARGSRARQELGELEAAFQALEQAYFKAWRESGLEDERKRQNLFIAVNIVGKVREHLRQVSDDGKLAESELNQIRQFGEPKKRFGIV